MKWIGYRNRFDSSEPVSSPWSNIGCCAGRWAKRGFVEEAYFGVIKKKN
jgi:hypothetical protein